MLVDKKFVPFKYTSCCTEPSWAADGTIEVIVAWLAEVATVTDAVPNAVLSAAEVAVMVTVPGEVNGAIYVPAGHGCGAAGFGQIKPMVELPPTTVMLSAVTLHVTAVFVAPRTVGVNKMLSPGAIVALLGAIETVTPEPT